MIPQRIIRPLWHPVSLLLSIVLVGLPPGLLGIEFPQSTEAAAVILAVVFILHYFVWSIPVRLGYITPPPEFGGGPDG